MLSKRGFSLIELLVVVVIIGVLASAGFVAYRAYIDTARDGVSSDRTEFINRSIDNDLVSIRNDLRSRSALAKDGTNDITSIDYCEAYRDSIVLQLNTPTGGNDKDLKNPFNNRKYACDGNAVADWFFKDNGSTSFQVDRGSTIIYCQNKGEAINSPGFGLLTCSCTGPDPCLTEPRPKMDGTIFMDNGSGTLFAMDNNSPQVSGTTMTQIGLPISSMTAYDARLTATEAELLGGKIIMRVDDNTTKSQEFIFSTVVKNPTHYVFIGNGSKLAFDTKALTHGTIFINKGLVDICWTPQAYISGSTPTPTEIANVNCMSKVDPGSW